MLDLNTIDPATVPASPELDALIAEKWMGWKKGHRNAWVGLDGSFRAWRGLWSPSTNLAHAGEVRMKAERWELTGYTLGVQCDIGTSSSVVCFHETNDDKGKAEALATCRAIVEALKAAEAAGGE